MRHEWLLEKNPLLAIKLRQFEGEIPVLPFEEILVPSSIEVLYIQGVRKIPPLSAEVVFVEKDLAKVYALLHDPEFPLHEKIHIIQPNEAEYALIAAQFGFKKAHFVGELTELRKAIDTHHMILSDYRDFGKRVLGNIRANLACKSVADGRDFKNAYKGQKCVVCGSGPSLEKGIEELRKGGALVIATGSSIHKLLRAGIPIDFGVFIDPEAPIKDYQEMLKHTFPLFYQNRVCRDFFALHQGEKIWMGSSEGWPVEDWILNEIGQENWRFDTGWNAGCFGFHIAKFLGFDTIETLGLDGGIEEKETGEWITRPDLHYGLQWIQELEEREVPEKKGSRHGASLEKVFDQLYDPKFLFAIDHFLEALKTGVDEKKFQIEHFLMEMELDELSFYQHWGEFLWRLFAPLYLQGEGKVEKAIAKALFLKRIFEAKNDLVERTSQEGKVVAIEYTFDGKREGTWKRFSKTGDLLIERSYISGVLHGMMSLYRNGKLTRHGEYKQGKKVGRHTIYHSNGQILMEAHFLENEPTGTHRTYDKEGNVLEELYYHTPKKFDRREFSKGGMLELEGKFSGDVFVEKRFENGEVASERKGEWKGERLVWI